MKSSMLYGGDLHSALDWLCLNLRDGKEPSTLAVKANVYKLPYLITHSLSFSLYPFFSHIHTEELPEGFSQRMHEENNKNKPKFQPPKEDIKQQVPKPEATKKAEQQKNTVGVFLTHHVEVHAPHLL